MTNAMTKLATIAMRARLTNRALHSFPRAPTSSPQDQLSMRSATTIRKSRATSVGASSAAPARRAEPVRARSEERRVGKEGRAGGAAADWKKEMDNMAVDIAAMLPQAES